MKTIRKIIFTDVFALARLIKKSGARTKIANLVQQYTSGGEANQEKLGIEAVGIVLESAPELQDDISEMLASFAGVPAEEIASAELPEIIELCKDICTQNNIGSFFSRAANLAAPKQ